MRLRLLDQGTIAAGVSTGARNLCFPDVLRLSDGSLWASWRGGIVKDSADGRVFFTRSRDGGRTWGEPVAPLETHWQGRPGEHHAGYLTELGAGHLLVSLLWVDRSDPSLPFFHPTTQGLLPTATLLTESQDDGRSWSAPRLLDPSPYTKPVTFTGPVLRLPGDTLLAQFEVNKEYHDPGPWRHAAVVKFSADGGRTWPRHVITGQDREAAVYYWDQRHAVLPDGRVLTAFWTYDAVAQRDLPIHTALSLDGATRWSTPRDTGLVGQCPFPVPLDNDRIVMLWVDRYGDACIRASLSRDGGESWDAAPPVTLYSRRDDPGAPVPQSDNTSEYLQEMELWDFGLPRGVRLPDGRVFVVHYAPQGAECTRIAWRALAVE